MRVLLLHPDDSPSVGPWSREKWDLLIDLGKSSHFSAECWSKLYDSEVIRLDSFRQGIPDAVRVRQILQAGRGRIIDEQGIDWWDLCSLLIAPEVFSLLTLRAISGEIPASATIWATHRSLESRILGILLKARIEFFQDSRLERSSARIAHYVGVFRQFSLSQLRQIVFDKYDSGYRWRSRFTTAPHRCDGAVVLVPSAYSNVSRTAASYARLLPEQRFLMVATRDSAKEIKPPSNIEVRDLAAYAPSKVPVQELKAVAEQWTLLRSELQQHTDLTTLMEAGVLDSMPGQIRNGICARNAWNKVLDSEPVAGVFCGDDSNLYTRLPVLLAVKRGIPTVDFHHGALDGRYMLKDLPCDLYLAKNDMERDYLVRVCGLPANRIAVGAPSKGVPTPQNRELIKGNSAIFFSEPYEGAGLRTAEVYSEILPPLCRLARENDRSVIVKLHPFETLAQRNAILQEVLTPADRKLITVIEGPLTPELMARAWFGITIESTTVIDCLQHGVCCFLCGWLSLSPYGYTQQYARFGIGEFLDTPDHIAEIPQHLRRFHASKPDFSMKLSPGVEPSVLRGWLTLPRAATFVRSHS